MQGLTFDAPGEVSVHDDLPDPVLEASTDAIVRVELAGLCGSDLHPYLGRERVRPGVVPGHEAVGEVVGTGSAVQRIDLGQRVVVPFTTSCGDCASCRRGLTARCAHGQLFGFGDPDDLQAPALQGAQAALLRVPLADTTAVAVPADLPAEIALLLADNLPTAWEAVARAEPEPGAPLAVVGLGAVGCCAVAAARAAGADPVIGIDPVAARRTAATRLGADQTVAPDDPAIAGLRSSVGSVVEAAGTSTAQRAAADLLWPGGTLSIIAVQTDDTFGFRPVDAYDRNLTIRAGRASVRATVGRVMAALTDGTVPSSISELVTHVAPLSDGPELYRRFADREDGLVKAAFRPAHGPRR